MSGSKDGFGFCYFGCYVRGCKEDFSVVVVVGYNIV